MHQVDKLEEWDMTVLGKSIVSTKKCKNSAGVQTSVDRVKGKKLEKQLESVHDCYELFE